MPAIAIVGAQWGDEGKGKVVDFLAARARMVVRYSGGNNAGHTVINQYGQFRLHLVPSGIFHPQVTAVIANGVVVDPAVLLEEIDLLQKLGVGVERIVVSDRAHLIMPYHRLLDRLEEEARGLAAIGTTQKGIGPAYADKAARLGIRTGDLLSPAAFRARLAAVLEPKNAIITRVYGAPPLALEEVAREYLGYRERLAPFIRPTEPLLEQALEQGELVLLEGAQGTLLDVDFGTYPFVTSSSPAVGGACTGSGISPTWIKGVIGVFKAYPTRVGSGPMPTEMEPETQQPLRERAGEYGATTGRPRRCGWFDGVAARYAARLNGFTAIAITRLDILDPLPRIKVAVGYRLDGERLERFPSDVASLERCQPVYQELPGWERDTSGVRRITDLPREAQDYVRRLEELVGAPACLVSVGPRREQTVSLREPF